MVSCHLRLLSLLPDSAFLVNRRPCGDSALTPLSPLGRLTMVFCGIVLHFPPFDLVPYSFKHSWLLELIQLSYTEINSKTFAFLFSYMSNRKASSPTSLHTIIVLTKYMVLYGFVN